MKITKKILAFVVGAALAFSAFAQDDFGGSDDFGSDDFGSFDSGESEESPFKFGGDIFAGVRAYVDQREEEDNNTTFSFENWQTWALPSAKFDFAYTGSRSAFSARLKFDKNSLGDYKWDILDEFTAAAFIGNFQIEAGKMRIVWGKGDKLHVLDNFNANDYTDYIIPDYLDRRISETMIHLAYTTNNNVKIEAVYTPWMTPDRLGTGVWTPKAIRQLTGLVTEGIMGEDGKLGNATTAKVTANTKLSVINALKARYDVANGAYKKAQAAGLTGNSLEPYEAELNAAITSLIGALQNPAITDQDSLDASIDAVMASLEKDVADAETAYLLALNEASNFSADDLYPDTYKFKYGQAGARITFAAGPVDLGFSYYYGHNKQPSVNKRMLISMKNPVTGEEMNPDYFGGDTTKITGGKLLDYDRVQVFGFEGAYVIPGIGLNTRWEVAYNLTDDIAGDDPLVANNSVSWVVGFDRDIPLDNISINIQTQGKVVLKHDKIDDMGVFKALDVDYVQKNDDGDGVYTNNKIVFDITDSWNYDKIKLDIKVIWGIERMDLLLLPSLSFNLADGFILDLSGLFIWCKNEYSEFDGWEHNSFGQIACKYKF